MGTVETQQDMEVLLALKEEEVSSLRQQMAQLTTDLKRNLDVLRSKDDDAQQLREAVDTLRNVIAEKDALFMQFQSQVGEMEEGRAQDMERIAALEAALEGQANEARAAVEAANQTKSQEVAALQSQLAEAEAKWGGALRSARQEALDEALSRQQHQQSQLEWAAQQASTLLQEGQNLAGVLAEKDAELETANGQLKRALESLQRLEETHKQTVEAKDAHIGELQERLRHVLDSGDVANADHESQINKLVISMTQMKEAYSSQSLEVQQLVTEQKRLVEERRLLKEQLKDTETALTKAQTEKGVLEGALQHEVTSQATAQAELNIFKAKLTEAVVDLEQRCQAAESRAGTLMGQLVEERGRLVDAVIEQASSTSPALAAELTRSLEADRAHTQAELQRAQERASSLQEDLALIRSTLLPLLAGHQGPAPGSSLAALTALQQQQKLAAAANQAHAVTAYMMLEGGRGSPGGGEDGGSVYGGAGAAEVWARGDDVTRTPSPGPRRVPGAATAAAGACSPGAHQLYSVTPGGAAEKLLPASPGMGAAAASPGGAGAAGSPLPSRSGRHQQHAAVNSPGANSPGAARGGMLSHLVGELQADVDKLQHQLNQSRQQLHPEHLPTTAAGLAAQAALTAKRVGNARPASISRPDTADTQHSMGSRSTGSAAATPDSRRSGSQAANGRSPDKSLAEALQYLMQRAEQLSAENGALKSKLAVVESHEGPKDASSSRRPKSSSGKDTGGKEGQQQQQQQGRRRQEQQQQQQHRGGAGSEAGGEEDSDRDCDAHSSMTGSDCGGSVDGYAGGIKAHRKPAANSGSAARARTSSAAAASPNQLNGSSRARNTGSSSRYQQQQQGAAATAAANLFGARQASSESEVLERILAGWPSSSKLSAVVRELVRTGGEAPAAPAPAARGLDRTRGAVAAGGTGSSVSPSLKQATLSAKAQLRRLAAMSPLRQRLDKML